MFAQMRRVIPRAVLMGLCVLWESGLPETAVAAPAAVPLSESYMLHSKESGRDYRISIAMPIGVARNTSARLPVVYVLDADELFGLATDTVRLLEDCGSIPPSLVVGIGYPIQSFDQAMEPRSTDFTPLPDPAYERLVSELSGGKRSVVTGGAAAFLRFLRNELKPRIASTYPVNPNDATLAGHSLGGLFGLYALFEAPDTFLRYVIGSPCLLCGDLEMFRRELAYAESRRDLQARLYLNVGNEEADLQRILNVPPAMSAAERRYLEATGHPDSVALFRKFVRQLESRRFPGLRMQAVVEPGEGHDTIPPLMFSRGLRAVFSETQH